MKKIVFIFCCIILLGCEPTFNATQVDDELGLALTTVDKQNWRFADHQGKWIIVNYWASWCKPCVTEVPELEAFYQKHKNTDAIVLGVNYDFVDMKQTAQLAQHYGITYPVLPSEPDPIVQMQVEPVMVLPTTYIINPQGQVIAKLIGEQSQQSLEHVIYAKK